MWVARKCATRRSPATRDQPVNIMRTSLLAGTVMFYFGWYRLMWIPVPVLILVCLALILVRKDELLHGRKTILTA